MLFHPELSKNSECDCQTLLSSLCTESPEDAKSHLHGPHLPRVHRVGKRIWMTENGVAKHFQRWLSWPSPLYLYLASWNSYHLFLNHLQFLSTKLRSVINFSETPLNSGYLSSSPFSPAKASLAAPSWSPAPDRFKHLNWKDLYATEMDSGSTSPLPPKTR